MSIGHNDDPLLRGARASQQRANAQLDAAKTAFVATAEAEAFAFGYVARFVRSMQAHGCPSEDFLCVEQRVDDVVGVVSGWRIPGGLVVTDENSLCVLMRGSDGHMTNAYSGRDGNRLHLVRVCETASAGFSPSLSAYSPPAGSSARDWADQIGERLGAALSQNDVPVLPPADAGIPPRAIKPKRVVTTAELRRRRLTIKNIALAVIALSPLFSTSQSKITNAILMLLLLWPLLHLWAKQVPRRTRTGAVVVRLEMAICPHDYTRVDPYTGPRGCPRCGRVMRGWYGRQPLLSTAT